jgi:hypothetical protein
MNEGGFPLVTHDGKIWKARRTHIIGAGERYCSTRGDGPRVLCKHKLQLFANHVRARRPIDRARTINFVEQPAPSDCYEFSRPDPPTAAPPMRR